ncbi:MAG: hypothetical protein Q7T05_03020 [Dehalococcoidia bacterium]|nr:hypothetical protein [Dehalococcoidia bacterium]
MKFHALRMVEPAAAKMAARRAKRIRCRSTAAIKSGHCHPAQVF